jgi:hypothetical protein
MSTHQIDDPAIHHEALAAVVASYAAMLQGYRNALAMQGGLAQKAQEQAKDKIATYEEEIRRLRVMNESLVSQLREAQQALRARDGLTLAVNEDH